MRSDFEVDGYEIEGLLGAGPTGETWLARDVTSGAQVALHRLSPRDAGSLDQARRLVERLGALDHPHVRRIRELIPYDDELVFVLDNLEGGSLEQLLLVRGILDPGELVTTAATVAGALAAAHERGLVHGALTPDAIQFTADGTPIVADIGFSALTTPADASPSGSYADPGEPDESEATPAGDVYSLAAICYAALTGLVPRAGEQPRPLHQVAPGVPPGLAHAIQAGLQSAWDMRPHMSQFGPLLEGASRPVPVRLPDGTPEAIPDEMSAPEADFSPLTAFQPPGTDFPPPTGRPLPETDFPPPGTDPAPARGSRQDQPAPPPARGSRPDSQRQEPAARRQPEPLEQQRQVPPERRQHQPPGRPDGPDRDGGPPGRADDPGPLGTLRVPPSTPDPPGRGLPRQNEPRQNEPRQNEPRQNEPRPAAHRQPRPHPDGSRTGGDRHAGQDTDRGIDRDERSSGPPPDGDLTLPTGELFDVEVGPTRLKTPLLPIAAGALLLVVAVVVAVLAWRASGGGPTAGETNRPGGPSTSPTATPTVSVDSSDPLAVRWAKTLTLFDQRRTNAFAHREPTLLAQLYAPESQAYTENREYMRELAAANVARVIGLTRPMSSLRTVSTGARKIVFEVVRQELPYTVAMNDGQQARCPGGPKKKVRIEIVPLKGTTAWRISREWQVGGRTTPEVQVCRPGKQSG